MNECDQWKSDQWVSLFLMHWLKRGKPSDSSLPIPISKKSDLKKANLRTIVWELTNWRPESEKKIHPLTHIAKNTAQSTAVCNFNLGYKDQPIGLRFTLMVTRNSWNVYLLSCSFAPSGNKLLKLRPPPVDDQSCEPKSDAAVTGDNKVQNEQYTSITIYNTSTIT
jgi:hypothetical protein